MRLGAVIPDRRIMVYTLILVGLGLVMVYGASSWKLGRNASSFGFLSLHLEKVWLGLVACAIAYFVPYRVAGRLATWGVWGALALLVATVTVDRFASEAHGISRWLEILGVRFQPVELVKLCLVLALPTWIDQDPTRVRRLRGGLLPLLVAPGLALVVLALQPNFGSALALAVICGSLLWVAGTRVQYLLGLGTVAVVCAAFAATHVDKVAGRVRAWKQLLLFEQGDNHFGYQAHQALVGMGNGGLTGAAPGEGITRYAFLPEGHTDFIFAIVGEELGFVGAALIVLVFALWMGRALKIALQTRDGLAYLMAIGIGVMISSYALLNLAVVTSLMPVAGLPLPFLSYGGSALLTNLAAVGVLLNISRSTRRERRPADRWQGARA